MKKGNEFAYFFAIDENYAKDVFKIGHTSDIIKRLNNYNVGRINEIDLKYLAIVYDSKEVEKCMKKKLEKYQYIKNKEIYKIDERFVLEVMKKCQCDDNHLCEMLKYLENKTGIISFMIIKKSNIKDASNMKGGCVDSDIKLLYNENKNKYLDLKYKSLESD